MDGGFQLAWDAAWLGAAGGTLPDLTRTFVGWREGDKDRWRDLFSAGFLVSALGLAALGFVVVLFSGAETPWGAVITGGAAPALLSSAWGQIERNQAPQADSLAAPTLWDQVRARWRR